MLSLYGPLEPIRHKLNPLDYAMSHLTVVGILLKTSPIFSLGQSISPQSEIAIALLPYAENETVDVIF